MICLTFIYLIILALFTLGFVFWYFSEGDALKFGGTFLLFVAITYLIVYIGGHYLGFEVPKD